jgi:ABC-type transporter Mla subunit MlaD
MSNDLIPISHISPSPTLNTKLGDRLRSIANQLRQEGDVQIKATSRILGAAAKLAENHDRLIDEVVEMVEEDLDQQTQPSPSESYTVERLKQQFGKLSDAKAHFGVKASSWANLAAKLNEPVTTAHSTSSYSEPSHTPVVLDQRLMTIESEIKAMRGEITQILKLLTQLLENNS